MSRTTAAALSLTAVLMISACADSSDNAEQVDRAAAGSNVQLTSVTEGQYPAAPSNGTTYRVSYDGVNAHGENTTLTGLVTLPTGPAPQGGYPVISWAHEVTGIAAGCGPSALDASMSRGDVIAAQANHLSRFLEDGYAVLQPDYEGLGSENSEVSEQYAGTNAPGTSTGLSTDTASDNSGGSFFNKKALASSVNELVLAARDHFELSDHWANLGWGQGGFAALAAAEEPAPGLVQTIATTPGDSALYAAQGQKDGEELTEVISGLDGRDLAFFSMVAAGALNSDGKLSRNFLSDEGRELVDQARQMCVDKLETAVTGLRGADLLAADANLDPLDKYLDSQSIKNMRPTGPTMVLHAENDQYIDNDHLEDLVEDLQGEKVDIKDVEIPHADHDFVLYDSVNMQIETVRMVFDKQD